MKLLKRILTAFPCIFLIIIGFIIFFLNFGLKNWHVERLINSISNLIFKLDEWGDK